MGDGQCLLSPQFPAPTFQPPEPAPSLNTVSYQIGSISKLMSTAAAEWVSAPADTYSGAGRRQLWQTGERHPAGHLDARPAAGASHRLANVVYRHVVSQHDVRACLERVIDLVEPLGLNFDPQIRTVGRARGPPPPSRHRPVERGCL